MEAKPGIDIIEGGTMAAKRVGVLTGGGDVPGLNSAIKRYCGCGK
jgi:hypothetical protein